MSKMPDIREITEMQVDFVSLLGLINSARGVAEPIEKSNEKLDYKRMFEKLVEVGMSYHDKWLNDDD